MDCPNKSYATGSKKAKEVFEIYGKVFVTFESPQNSRTLQSASTP
jgi:hypothetical protein